MHTGHTTHRHLLPLSLIPIMLTGCGGALTPRDEPSSLAATVLTPEAETTFLETDPNDGFDIADFVPLTDRAQRIRGGFSGSNDLDVYDLGPVTIGDRVEVAFSPDEGTRGTISLFDADRNCLLVNDDRNTYLGRREPFIDVVIRRSSTACYAAVGMGASDPIASQYTLTATRRSGGLVPPTRPDVVLLDFDGGGEVIIGNRPAVHMPPFDAAGIDNAYTGTTNQMIRLIVEKVRADLAPFDVAVRSTHESRAFDPTATRIHFGAFDESLLGVADGIDEFNVTRRQEAIIFTDSFAAMSPLSPTVEEMAQALANITSHEIGHLLGLVHTRDPQGLMDISASLAQLLNDQRFRVSDLATDVFPIGSQDAPGLLVESVGGDLELARALAQPTPRSARSITTDPQHARTPLSTCDLGEYRRYPPSEPRP